jgi:arabidopsis histidine kinase 2/3/4 (cytokinin receptor)
VAYAQRVLRSEREAFERQQGWTIKSFEGVPSPEKDEYAPVIYSQETVSYIEALDMMSGEVSILFFPAYLHGEKLVAY